MSLNFKASNIAKAEREYKENFFEAMAKLSRTPSMSLLLFLWQAGGGDEDSFDDEIKNGFDDVLITIMEGINEAGFLGTKIDIQTMKKELQKTKASENTGEATKA